MIFSRKVSPSATNQIYRGCARVKNFVVITKLFVFVISRYISISSLSPSSAPWTRPMISPRMLNTTRKTSTHQKIKISLFYIINFPHSTWPDPDPENSPYLTCQPPQIFLVSDMWCLCCEVTSKSRYVKKDVELDTYQYPLPLTWQASQSLPWLTAVTLPSLCVALSKSARTLPPHLLLTISMTNQRSAVGRV